MYNPHKLVVAGCSVSDRGDCNICYGDALRVMLNVPYIHHGSGCGSNYRIWRVITNMILNNELTSNDQLIIQYTTINRREFWTSNWVDLENRVYNSAEKSVDNTGVVTLVEPYSNGGLLVKYKNRAEEWQTNSHTEQFFRQYGDQFNSEAYSYDLFRINHYNFYNTIKAAGIPTLWVSMLGYHHPKMIDHTPDANTLTITKEDVLPEHLQADSKHFNDLGHQRVAELIKEHLYKDE